MSRRRLVSRLGSFSFSSFFTPSPHSWVVPGNTHSLMQAAMAWGPGSIRHGHIWWQQYQRADMPLQTVPELAGTQAVPKGQVREIPACPKEPGRTTSIHEGCNNSSCMPSNRLSKTPAELLLHSLHWTQRPEELSLYFHSEGRFAVLRYFLMVMPIASSTHCFLTPLQSS